MSNKNLPVLFGGHRFKPGVAANPTGYSGNYGEVRKMAKAAAPQAVMRLIELMQDEDGRVAYMAATALLDRGYGKVTEAKEDKAMPTRIDMSKLSVEELKAMESSLEKVLGKDAALNDDAPIGEGAEVIRPTDMAEQSENYNQVDESDTRDK